MLLSGLVGNLSFSEGLRTGRNDSVTVFNAFILDMDMEGELESAIHIPVDVRIINNAPLSFIYNILKKGIVIVDNDKSLRTDFEGLVYKKYFDFQHLRREYLREIINAPV